MASAIMALCSLLCMALEPVAGDGATCKKSRLKKWSGKRGVDQKKSKTHISADVVESPLVAADGSLQAGKDIRPGSVVLVLFLSKDQLGVGVFVAFLFDDVERERTDLFDPGDGDLVLKSYLVKKVTNDLD